MEMVSPEVMGGNTGSRSMFPIENLRPSLLLFVFVCLFLCFVVFFFGFFFLLLFCFFWIVLFLWGALMFVHCLNFIPSKIKLKLIRFNPLLHTHNMLQLMSSSSLFKSHNEVVVVVSCTPCSRFQKALSLLAVLAGFTLSLVAVRARQVNNNKSQWRECLPFMEHSILVKMVY